MYALSLERSRESCVYFSHIPRKRVITIKKNIYIYVYIYNQCDYVHHTAIHHNSINSLPCERDKNMSKINGQSISEIVYSISSQDIRMKLFLGIGTHECIPQTK